MSRKTFEPPTHATAPRRTLADLNRQITVGQAIEAIEAVTDDVADLVMAIVEDWSEGDKLHRQPFEKDLRNSLGEKIAEMLETNPPLS